MALKTSLVITGDGSDAKAALDALDKGMADASAEAKRMEKAFADADRAIEQLAAAQTRAKEETLAARVALKAGEISAKDYNARLLETKTALSLVETGHRGAVTALKQAQNAIGGATVSLAQARAGYTNFGRNVQDVAVQVQGGANLGTIIAQQGGQIADAVAQMGGRFAGIASFLAGPWGAALIVGTGLLVDLGLQFFETGDDADKAKKKIFDYSGSLAALAENADLAHSAMERLQESLAQGSPATDAADKSTKVLVTAGGKLSQINRDIAATNKLLSSSTLALGGADAGMAMVNRLAQLQKQKVEVEKTIKEARSELEQIRSSGIAANIAEASKRRLSELGKRDKPDRKTGASAAAEAARRIEYGEDLAKKIANISDQFADLPTGVTRANKAMRELDDISSDLARRDLTPNVKSLIGQVAGAREVIEDSLNRPFNDFLESSREAVEIDKMLIAGRDDEAEALKIILSLKEKQRPLDKAQIDAVLATVRNAREYAMVLRDQRALIAANVAAVQDFRGALEQTVADAFRGRFSIERVLSSIGNSYVNIMSQKVVEGLFGDTLRQLEAQASGADKVDAAGVRIAGSLDKGASAVEGFADRVNRALVNISGDGPSLKAGNVLADAGRTISDLFDKVAGDVATRVAQKSGGVPEGTGDEIVVTANKSRKVDLSGTGAMLINMVDQSLRRFGIIVPKVLTDSLKSVFGRLEQSLPQALQGAFTGAAASKLILGNGGSSVGGAIGGAIGQKMGEKFLSSGLEKIGGKLLGSFAGPLGGILGGVLGGALGGLFKKTQWGSATITNGDVSSAGNKQDYTAGASTAAGTVSGAINQIADRLGASVGKYAVSIGLTNGNWNVNGGVVNGKIGTKWQRDTIDFKKDEAGALSWAIGNAISDGAITGISAAVAKALKSSTDIDKALAEALKVQDVELLIGGVGAEMEKAFRDFENQAKERLRIARDYGFDLAKLEERNAADRLKLSEQLFRQQAGSLQDLIDELTSGSLFEGSAIERRDLLLEQIDATRAKADAGEEGAADKLAQLLQQFNEVSKEVYGTTGGFAADRATILDVARDTVAAANRRIQDAQAATDPALQTTNTTLDEIAEQNAKSLQELGLQSEYLKRLLASFGSGTNSALSDLARTS